MKKASLTPIILPCVPCSKCGHEHPTNRMMNPQQTAGYLDLSVQTVYKYKSLHYLPDVILGRRSPRWVPCELAKYLHGERAA